MSREETTPSGRSVFSAVIRLKSGLLGSKSFSSNSRGPLENLPLKSIVSSQLGSSVADIHTDGHAPDVAKLCRRPANCADVLTPLPINCGSSNIHRQSLLRSPKSIGQWNRLAA